MKREIPPGCVPIHPGNKEDVLNAVRDLFIGMRNSVSTETMEKARQASIWLLAAARLGPDTEDTFGEPATETVETLLMIAFMREPRLPIVILDKMQLA